ncbi:sigma-70 family RNA polymerase sigma factor [bacterium]|nr:sigma-70 family RNA polymerase sigma factor [Pirellulales bacterium]RQV94631.1 MAG: sigma-70 family RNA polymerase sigma factor [bacterium]
MTDVQQILVAIEHGDAKAAEQLLPLVYDELRKLAAVKLANEKPGQTLQATALVHEAYLRLVDTDNVQHWEGRGHFFAAAAESMRRILVENYRRKRRLKRGGKMSRNELEEVAVVMPQSDLDLVELDAALRKLEAKNTRRAQVVKLRYYAGLTVEEAAATLGVSTSTVDRDWTYARAWLFCEMSQKG